MKVKKVEPDDFVLMAFSCHGDTDSKTGEYYLIPSDIGDDTTLDWTTRLKEHGISSAELTDWLRDVDAGDMAMIIDSCHSAAVAGQDFQKPGPMDSRGLGQLAWYKQMRLLSASKADRTAKETEHLRHGLLTYALLNEGLHRHVTGAESKGGVMTLQKWLQFGVSEVPHLDEREGVLHTNATMQIASTNTSHAAPGTEEKNASFAYSRVAEGQNQHPAKRDYQTPSLLDFSRKAQDVIIMSR
jgi:hypothetical protein